ncbi:transglutaminase domain-containing protein [Streptomyces sp. ODS05-4]|uniref:transglutaminase domain-containing protein n=1 Tax=Streptomyces sp. ODS05-4 TaxID=2944939 RepID=UPI002108F5E4|nr:transglutaminase domain-containing protein [Streptomyces sp. ODS05-4]
MRLIQQDPDLSAYLAADEVIDHDHAQVRRVVNRLAIRHPDVYEYAEAAFNFVRDEIPHSMDTGDPRVTWRASDAIARRTGICYAKAHALAALLRARSIPTALCYQGFPVIHGLVAVRLPGREDWIRQDPRGGEAGRAARFDGEREHLAFTTRPEAGERDYLELYAAPHPAVLHALRTARDRAHLETLLPQSLKGPAAA